MRFRNNIKLYGYDNIEIVAGQLHDLIHNPDSRYALSGLEDLPEILNITGEWYEKMCPILDVREMRNSRSPAPAEVDPLYLEPVSGRFEIDRAFRMPVSVKESVSRKKHTKEAGTEREQTIELYVGLYWLSELDYWPAEGDLFRWRGQWLQVNSVTQEPSDYWGHTAIPLHIRMAVAQYRYDGTDLNITSNGEQGVAIPGSQPQPGDQAGSRAGGPPFDSHTPTHQERGEDQPPVSICPPCFD